MEREGGERARRGEGEKGRGGRRGEGKKGSEEKSSSINPKHLKKAKLLKNPR